MGLLVKDADKPRGIDWRWVSMDGAWAGFQRMTRRAQRGVLKLPRRSWSPRETRASSFASKRNPGPAS